MPDKIRVIIVDDEPYARRGIIKLLANDEDIAVVYESGDAEKAVTAINALEPDVVFLDIQMPGLNGFEVLKRLLKIPAIVFITAYDSFAIKAFEVNALDYLVKPFSDLRFQSTLNRVRDHVRNSRESELSQNIRSLIENHTKVDEIPALMSKANTENSKKGAYINKIMVKKLGEISFINVAEITWIEAMDYYIKLYTATSSYLIRDSMKNLEKKLDPKMFIRTHRSAIVRIEQIKSVGSRFSQGTGLILKDGTEVKLSRSRKSILRKRISP